MKYVRFNKFYNHLNLQLDTLQVLIPYFFHKLRPFLI